MYDCVLKYDEMMTDCDISNECDDFGWLTEQNVNAYCMLSNENVLIDNNKNVFYTINDNVNNDTNNYDDKYNNKVYNNEFNENSILKNGNCATDNKEKSYNRVISKELTEFQDSCLVLNKKIDEQSTVYKKLGVDEIRLGIVNKLDTDVMRLMEIGEHNIIKGNDSDMRPFGRVTLNNVDCECLFDTGAKISVISAEILKLIKGYLEENKSTRISCANGSPLRILGQCTLKIKYRGLEVNHVVFVANEIIPEVIIGVDILERIGVKLIALYGTETLGKICNLEGKFTEITDDTRRKILISKQILPEKHPLYKLILKYGNIFMASKWDIGKTDILKHHIITEGPPIAVPARRQPMHFEGKIQEIIENLEKHGIISKCESPWNSPIVCVSKKNSEEIRMCLDFRLLNAKSVRPAFPLPNVNEMMDSLHGSKYFSTIDLGSAYYQVELEEKSKEKTAFSTKYGQYCFNRMPFGIAAAPSTFQKLMTIVIGDMNWRESLVYLDDILVFSKTLEDHIRILEKLFTRISGAGLKLNPDKCKFLVPEIKFLGHIINSEGIKTDMDKIDVIKKFERPKCVKHVRSFLGLVNYYRKFIKDYSRYSRPLESLINVKNKSIVWTDECDRAFTELKEKLSNTPILRYPDFSQEFILDTDASFDTIGAVLSQTDREGRERVIAFGSRSMTKHELGYCITRKELLAVFHFTQHFKHYLYGKRFILRTDHRAITFMLTTRKPITAQFQNWINFLSSLNIKLEYRKGEKHGNADAISRMNTELCKQCQMEHIDAKRTKCQTRLLAMDQENLIPSLQADCQEIKEISKKIGTKECLEYNIVDGLVQKKNKIYVPREKREEFIKLYHRILCHAGSQKVFKFLQDNYEMDQFEETVRNTVRSCKICQEGKVFTEKTKEVNQTLTAKEPFESLYIDFCGPLRTTLSGKKYILAIIDQFSKYIILRPVTSQDEKTLVKILTEYWILKFGTPKVIHVDNGRCFVSTIFKQLAKKYNFDIQYSSPYHHQANGQIERQFRTIRDWLYCCIKDKLFRDWEECLPHIEFTMNSTIQKTTMCSPGEVIFGRKLSIDRFVGVNEDTKGKSIRYKKIAQIMEHTGPEKEKVTSRSFEIGDLVYVKVENRHKQEKRYDGPYTVIRKNHERSYRLQKSDGTEIVRNVEWLTPSRAGRCE